ncbi:MAG: signal recognition particle-docking protein FtsY [Phycisphaerales bacterium]|nr:signal recognition particle-docking protein FtsY [Phycisphaerales bacterium]
MGIFKSTLSAVRKGLGRTRDTMAAPLGSLLRGKQLDDAAVDEIETILLRADVGVSTTSSIISELRAAVKDGNLKRGEDAIDFLRVHLRDQFGDTDRSLANATTSPTVVLVAGVNGVGKTTSVAKITWSLMQEGRSVLVAAADTYRAAAVEQLGIWSERLGFDLVKGQDGADPAAVTYDATEAAVARGADVLLVDTAGRMHTEKGLMRQLNKIQSVIRKLIPDAPHEVLLVLDATQGQNALAQAKAFQETIDLTGIMLAKLDGTARGGIVLAIHDALDIPVKLVGLGERPEDIEPFDPDAFTQALFEE